MQNSFQQRVQYRPMPKALALNLPGIAAYALFQFAWIVPILVAAGQIRDGYDPRQLWWLLAAPGSWLLAHLLWYGSDVAFFYANRAEARRDERGFFLLLRPFKQTAATAIKGAPELPGIMGRVLRGTHPMIWQYGVHLAPLGRLVTVGTVRLPKPVLSNDTVCVRARDDNWMDIVRALAQRSRAIILLFDEGEGIVGEVLHLSESGLTGKTIIRVAPIQPLAADPEASQQRWREANKLLESHGLHPPEPAPEGFLYIPQPDFSIRHAAALGQGTENALRELLELIPASSSESSLREAMETIDEFELRTFGKSSRAPVA